MSGCQKRTSEGEGLTITHQRLHDVRVRRKVIHPPPPSKCSEWLQDTVAGSELIRNPELNGKWSERTYKINTNVNIEVNNNPAISTDGAIAAMACPTLV